MRPFLPYLKYLRRVRGKLAAGVLCGILYGLVGGLGMPLMVRYVIPRVLLPDPPASSGAAHREPGFLNRFLDHLLPPAPQAPPAANPARVPAAPAPPARPQLTGWQVWVIAMWLPLIFLVRGVAGYLNSYLIQYAGVRILEEIRTDYFRKLQSLPLAFFHRISSGELIARGLNDTNQLQNTLTVVSNDLIKQPATLIGTMAAMAVLAYQEQGLVLVLVCLLTVPVAVFPIRYIGKKLLSRAIQLQAQTGTLTDRFTENLGAVKEVRAFGLEGREIDRFSRLSGLLVRANMKVVKYAQMLAPSIEILSAIGISITFVYAYRFNVHSGSFLGILAALFLSYEPLKKLGAVNNELKRGTASLRRLEVVLSEPETIREPAQPVAVGRLRGDIAFEAVDFAYKPNEPVLRSLSARIPAGTTCALVGPSGAGKTTCANLLPRFYDPVDGRVTIDGIDLRTMRLADLRRNIAVVPQDPVLFNDTIYNNLVLGRPDATREEVEQAARNAYAHDFIRSFPKGYDTLVGERGALVSGGQKQRLALARAFLRNAPILILDEAMSALDAESEAAIQAAQATLVVGKTVLIIAHRFSTIRDASLILVFDRGSIVASGDHAKLYATNGLYQSLFDRQKADLA
ncbi:MAG TPA: ABC transporter ATP-binding protein [Opitutaceae bacterium]|jgi:subfamily B ATP-binding cassette protein MsbA